jgi:hypothetical protein
MLSKRARADARAVSSASSRASASACSNDSLTTQVAAGNTTSGHLFQQPNTNNDGCSAVTGNAVLSAVVRQARAGMAWSLATVSSTGHVLATLAATKHLLHVTSDAVPNLMSADTSPGVHHKSGNFNVNLACFHRQSRERHNYNSTGLQNGAYLQHTHTHTHTSTQAYDRHTTGARRRYHEKSASTHFDTRATHGGHSLK